MRAALAPDVPVASARVIADPASGRWQYAVPRPGDLPARARATAGAVQAIADALRESVLPELAQGGAARGAAGLAISNLRQEAGRLVALAEDLAAGASAAAAPAAAPSPSPSPSPSKGPLPSP